MQKNSFFKFLSVSLVFTLFLFTLPSQGWAMFIASSQEGSTRQSDLMKVQRALESSIIKQRIMDYGLSPEEAMARISTLSDEQIHRIAQNADSLQAGGDALGALIFLVLVAILVVLILEVTGHKVIIR